MRAFHNGSVLAAAFVEAQMSSHRVLERRDRSESKQTAEYQCVAGTNDHFWRERLPSIEGLYNISLGVHSWHSSRTKGY